MLEQILTWPIHDIFGMQKFRCATLKERNAGMPLSIHIIYIRNCQNNKKVEKEEFVLLVC